MSTVLPDLYKIAENAAISSIDQAIPRRLGNGYGGLGETRGSAPVKLDRGARAFGERRALEVGQEGVERFFVELGGEHELGAFGADVGFGDDRVDRV